VDEVECAVIGGGVIGLAAARALALAGRETIILEREDRIGSGISSRNSEVIHAGLYYPANSLKARFCVEGRARLYAHCDAYGVNHRRCGKLIVAAHDGQIPELEAIAAAAARNGVKDIQMLSAAEATAMEPHLRCAAALFSPSTGIVDSHGLMLSYLGDAEANGAVIAYGVNVAALEPQSGGVCIYIEGDPEAALKARLVVNAASDQKPASGFCPARVLRQGQLFFPWHACALFAPDLSGARAWRPRRASDLGSGGPSEIRAGRRMG
jgi:L-2-hydroxyglutarate oxidase LhgO